MSEPFLSEIKIFPFNFAPKGWAFCDGQLLPINQNQALFALLGTTYGGNGQTNFALPDLQGRTPIHRSNSHTLGKKGGAQTHTLSVNELPQHQHSVRVSASTGGTSNPSGNYLTTATSNIYAAPSNLLSLNPAAVTNAGSSQPHENMQPYLTLNFCIALQGIFPSHQ